MQVKLTHKDTKEEIWIDLEEILPGNIRKYPNYVISNEVYPYLTEDMKKAWTSGWRGYLRYFHQ